MLSESEAAAMEVWVLAAERWSDACQALLGAIAGLSLVSVTLADQLHSDGVALPERASRGRASLADELGALATALDEETRTLRDAHLGTTARIESYKGLLS
jgi:hypothetical protein